jgi:hypothetical protein
MHCIYTPRFSRFQPRLSTFLLLLWAQRALLSLLILFLYCVLGGSGSFSIVGGSPLAVLVIICLAGILRPLLLLLLLLPNLVGLSSGRVELALVLVEALRRLITWARTYAIQVRRALASAGCL